METISINAEIADQLLNELKATFTDKNLWPDPAYDEGEDTEKLAAEHEAEVMAAWGDLHRFTCECWDAALYRDADTPDDASSDLCERYNVLSNCWRLSFIQSIITVADRQSDPGKIAFLYFMVGCFESGWTDYLKNIRLKRAAATA